MTGDDARTARVEDLSPEQRELLNRLLRQKGVSLARPPIRPRPRDGKPPIVSFSQERLWFLNRLDPDSPAYNLTFVAPIEKAVDGEALQRSLDELVRRHEILRTSYPESGGRPLQHIAESGGCPLELVDLRMLPEAEQTARIRTLVDRIGRSPFDLARGPILRAALVRTAEAEYRILFAVHHIAVDGLSIEVLFRELDAIHDAFSQGLASPLTDLPIQYADFAVWQRELLRGSVLQQHLDYLRTQLDHLPRLELPTDFPRPPRPSFRGASLVRSLPPELEEGLKSLARQEGATFFMVVLAAFKVLLHRYTSQAEIVIGAPVANRDQQQLEHLIGFFVNTLVLRTDLGGDPTFRELLARVRKVTLAGFEHQELPFEKLVEELAPERDLSRNPLFQVMFGLHKTSLEDLKLGGGSGSKGGTVSGGMDDQTTRFDLEVVVAANDAGVTLAFVYATDLFEAATIERMAEHFEILVQGVVANPDTRIGSLPLLSPAEAHRLLVEWNATRVEYPAGECLHHLVERQVALTPDAVAVQFEQASLTYRELDARAELVAHWLRRHAVEPDVLVGVCMERSLDMVVAFLGILKAGGAFVPLDPSYPAGRLAFMLADSAAPVVLTQQYLRSRLEGCRALIRCLDTDWAEFAAAPATEAGQPPGSTSLAYVIYTSGSTGQPKGALNTHAGICNRLRWMQDRYGLGSEDRVLQKTPFTFDVSVWEFFWPLMTGARLVMARPGGHQDPAYLVSAILQHGITTLHFVPSMLRVFLETEGVEACAGLRRVFSSGEALSADVVRRYFERLGAPLHNLYGPTETAVDVSHYTCDPDRPRSPVPIGRPVANTRLHVLDVHLRPVAIGVPGELHIGGVQVGRGYLGRPDLTAERFVPDPFAGDPPSRLYKTGDIARYLPDGNLEYLGRADSQVKLRGFRIELEEVESAIARDPKVRAVTVTVREDRPGDQRLVAYIVPAEATAPTAEQLRRSLLELLPEYMLPTAVVPLPAIPLTPSGKIDRRALPPPSGEPRIAAEHVAPRNATEEALVSVWQEVLGVKRIGVRDSFFDLGGHSLLATQLVSRVRDLYHVELPLRALFVEPTIEAIALTILQRRAGSADLNELGRLLAELEEMP